MSIRNRIEYSPAPPIPSPETEDLQVYVQNELQQVSGFIGELSEVDKNNIVHTYVVFNGVSSYIYNSSNVTSVSRTSAGTYDITFERETAGVFYAISITTNNHNQLAGYTNVATDGVTITIQNTAGTYVDPSRVHVMLVGDI